MSFKILMEIFKADSKVGMITFHTSLLMRLSR